MGKSVIMTFWFPFFFLIKYIILHQPAILKMLKCIYSLLNNHFYNCWPAFCMFPLIFWLFISWWCPHPHIPLVSSQVSSWATPDYILNPNLLDFQKSPKPFIFSKIHIHVLSSHTETPWAKSHISLIKSHIKNLVVRIILGVIHLFLLYERCLNLLYRHTPSYFPLFGLLVKTVELT